MISKEAINKKTLENIGKIITTEKDLETKENKKINQKLFKFENKETYYYTENQLKYLYNLYSEKLKKTMQNIFTCENERLKKQLTYTMVCKSLGEANVFYTLEKFEHEDKEIVGELLKFLKDQLEEYQENLENLEYRFKTEEINNEDYEKEKNKLNDDLNTINEALKKPEDEEMTEDFLQKIKDDFEYFEKNVINESYKRDLKNKKDYKKYLKFYQTALEENKSEMKDKEILEFK